jgi:glycosyltransferase involved in cell wall biosynthesis
MIPALSGQPAPLDSLFHRRDRHCPSRKSFSVAPVQIRPILNAMTKEPLVSVVIPSIGKPTLREAIASVLAQTYSNLEIVVRLDPSSPLGAVDNLPSDSRVRVVPAPSHEEISVGRERALHDCNGSFVAFLDDDDRFLSQKLQHQMEAASRILSNGADHVIVACRVLGHDAFGGTQVVPRSIKRRQESVSEYLFRRRQIRPGAAEVRASMLLCDKQLAIDLGTGVPSSLHEDWEWAIRAERQPNTEFVMLPEVLAEYASQPEGTSASSRSSWLVSAKWVTDHHDVLSRRCRGDFLLCVTLPLAVAQRDWSGVLRITLSSLRAGPPGLRAWTFAILYVVLPGSVRRWATAATLRLRRSDPDGLPS